MKGRSIRRGQSGDNTATGRVARIGDPPQQEKEKSKIMPDWKVKTILVYGLLRLRSVNPIFSNDCPDRHMYAGYNNPICSNDQNPLLSKHPQNVLCLKYLCPIKTEEKDDKDG